MIEKSSAPGECALTVLQVDPHFIAVEKPSGLLSVPGRGEDKADCALARVSVAFPEVLVVHRLDQPTSGILLFARNPEAQRRLSDAFAQREVFKRYEAVVEGRIGESRGRIEMPLIADWPNRPLQKVDFAIGKPATTDWQRMDDPAAEANGMTRVSLEPLTGRSHQLRVHLRAMGHPIVGDQLYGTAAGQAASERLLLHAAELRFPHPVSGEPVEVRSAVPF